MKRGNLFILSGPAGAGKGTLRKRLSEKIPEIVYSISCTTRDIRPGEVDGLDYYFISKNDFEARITRGELLEWAEVHGNFYGTGRSYVESFLNEGRDVLLEIDVQGRRQVKSRLPEAISIFITAPSLEDVEKRLRGRRTETQAQLDTRLRNAAMEMKHAGEYDHVIINDDLHRAENELVELVKKYRE